MSDFATLDEYEAAVAAAQEHAATDPDAEAKAAVMFTAAATGKTPEQVIAETMAALKGNQ